MRSWTARHWLWAAAGTVAAAMATGIPTALIPNPLFARGIAAPWWAYPVWIASAVLSGLLIATYAADDSRAEHRRNDRRSITGAVLSFLAVGCPTCNKLVLLALGTNGALTWFGPIQPVLAVGSLLLPASRCGLGSAPIAAVRSPQQHAPVRASSSAGMIGRPCSVLQQAPDHPAVVRSSTTARSSADEHVQTASESARMQGDHPLLRTALVARESVGN